MKILFTLFTLIPFFTVAQKHINSQITETKVFSEGAQIFRISQVDLGKGKNELIFHLLEDKIKASSIRIKTSNAVTILYLNHQKSINSSSSESQKKLSKYYNTIDSLKTEITNLSDQEKLVNLQEDFLMKNQVVGGANSGLKPDDLKSTAQYFEDKLTSLFKQKKNLQNTRKILIQKIKDVNKLINSEETNEAAKSSEILVELESDEAITETFEISYFIDQAGWLPKYNIKVKDIASPIRLDCNADIFQYSGKDWNQIDISLSNGKPNNRSILPILKPWSWGSINTYDEFTNPKEELEYIEGQITGRVTEEDSGEGIPGVSIQIKGTSHGVSTDINGYYRLNIPPNLIGKSPVLKYSFVGFEPVEREANQSKIDVILKSDANELNEVVVVGYGISGRVSGVNISPNSYERKVKTLKKLVTNTDQTISRSFKLNDKFSVPSDARVYTAALEELEIPVTYEYKTVPKVDPSAYLSASITNWESLNLLEGEATLFFEGTYLGKTKLKIPDSDTLTISLGKDESILINRKEIKAYSKKKFLSNSIEEQFEFRISVRNTKNLPITIAVQDQIPLSSYKEVDVFDVAYPNAKLNEETGMVEWLLKLEAKEEQELTLKYTVKYPKSGMVSY